MKKLLLFTAGFVCFIMACHAQKCMPDAHFWSDFSGKLGDMDIDLSIYRPGDGTIVGNYRYTNDDTTVFQLAGKEVNCSYIFNVSGNKKIKGALVFKYTYDAAKKEDKYEGTFTDEQKKTVSVKLQHVSMVYGTENNRYGGFPGSTAEVDSFAVKIKTAIIDNNVQWLAANCCYPLRINEVNAQPVIIKNKEAFLYNYKKYFNKAYRDKFKKVKCYNMFNNHSGVSVGNGLIWINRSAASAINEYQYCIISINVF